MSERVRSKTGCLTCKNRRKKCDEKRPICERCTKAKIECLGYSHLDNPPERRRRTATRPRAPPAPTEGSGLSDQAPSTFPSPLTHSMLPSPGLHPTASTSQCFGSPANTSSFQHFSGTSTHRSVANPAYAPELSLLAAMPTFSPQDMVGRHASVDGNLVASVDPNQWFHDNFGTPSRSPLGLSSNNIMPGPLSSDTCDSIIDGQYPMLSGDDSTGLGFGHLGYSSSGQSEVYSGPLLSPRDLDGLFGSPDDDSDSSSSEDSETENTQALVYRTLTLDRRLTSNTLPFVVENYAKWMMHCVFDPIKLVHQVKDFLFYRLGRSESARSVTILKANVLRLFIKNPGSVVGPIPALPLLADSVHGSIAAINSKTTSPEFNFEEVLDTVGSVMELIYLHEISKPLSVLMNLIEACASVYRRARPEPLGAPVKLRSCLLHSDMAIRHFPATDILYSVRTGRPMSLKYDTDDTPEPHENPPGEDDTGLRWMHGIPDLFLVMLAKINMLREDFGTDIHHSIITELQTQVEAFKPVAGTSDDPLMNVMVTIIQESWRQVMFIYIFMGLGGANSADPLVTQPLKRFIKLLNNAKPTRNQDLFLLWPMIIAGVAAVRRKDRDLIQRRMLGLKECSQPGTCGFDSVRVMSEIWTRSDAEMRPAVWMDLRLATLKVARV